MSRPEKCPSEAAPRHEQCARAKRFVALRSFHNSFAICNLSFAICSLPNSVCLCSLPDSFCFMQLAICSLQKKQDAAASCLSDQSGYRCRTCARLFRDFEVIQGQRFNGFAVQAGFCCHKFRQRFLICFRENGNGLPFCQTV